MNFEQWFQQQQPKISLHSANEVLKLAADGATVPFMARYRKEQTGNLDEVGIQAVLDAKENWDQVIRRQAFIIGEIDHQKKLTPELKEKILSAFQLELLEDLYLPYKQKRKSKATLAKEAGLEPLADWLWECGHGQKKPEPGQTPELWAFTFRNEEKGFADAAAVLEGAKDILVERLSEKAELRQRVRSRVFERGSAKTGKAEKAKANSKYSNYFEYNEKISSLLLPQNSHRYLAIRRGWIEEELTLGIGGAPDDEAFETELQQAFETEACTERAFEGAPILLKAAKLAYKVHVLPSIENEVHKALKEVADEASIRVFAENVRELMLASPFGAKAVLGVDPGIRTGCKIVLIDDSGKYLASTVMHLQSETEREKAAKMLLEVMRTGNIQAVAVGNGTAGRETEIFIRQVLAKESITVPVVMVSESGASVYSASEVAREEFPELDVTVRGAISIARRLQDPLAELVKIDPKSIGVGQYQHDVSQPALKRSLDQVVESCVNSVGVSLNTASYHLLAHVSGIGDALARAIVQHRTEKGLFKARTELLEVPRFSAKAYEQAAGFLRIPGVENPLDNTGVHPEAYPVLEELASKLGKKVAELTGVGAKLVRESQELRDKVGQFTFEDIVRELEKPGRDPREAFVPFQYRDDIHGLKDLKPGLVCPGIVTNVTNFGAFVDIGVHQDGLVHLSQLADRYVKDAHEVVKPGDRVKVRVLEVNLEKSQISLSMKNMDESRQGKPASERKKEKSGRGPKRGRGERKPVKERPPTPEQLAAKEKLAAAGAALVTPNGPGGKPATPNRPVPGKPRSGNSNQPARPQFTNNPFAALANFKPGGKD